MKKILKKMLQVFLIIAVTFSVISPLQVSAAPKGKAQNIDMYIGQVYEYTNFSKIQTIKNTKKSVVESSKRDDKYLVLEAKKAGKTKITAKTQYGTALFNITVKEAKFEYKFYPIANGEILAEIINKTSAIFDNGKFKYTLKGSDGTEYASDEVNLYSLIPGVKNYTIIYFDPNTFEPDLSKTEMKMVSIDRSVNRNYANADKKISVKDKVKTQAEDEVVVTLTAKNTGKKPMSGYLRVVFYDPSGAIIDVVNLSLYLKAGSIETKDAKCYLKMINYETKQRVLYDHYEIIKNVYTSEIKK